MSIPSTLAMQWMPMAVTMALSQALHLLWVMFVKSMYLLSLTLSVELMRNSNFFSVMTQHPALKNAQHPEVMAVHFGWGRWP